MQCFLEFSLGPVLFLVSISPLDSVACVVGVDSNTVVLVIISDCSFVFFQSGFQSSTSLTHIGTTAFTLYSVDYSLDSLLWYLLLDLHQATA